MKGSKSKIEEIQTKIYQKMPVIKKLKLVNEFYKTGKILNQLKNGARKNSNRDLNSNRQNT